MLHSSRYHAARAHNGISGPQDQRSGIFFTIPVALGAAATSATAPLTWKLMEITDSFVLLVRKESLTISEHGSIWGEIRCRFSGDQHFPEARWTDFVVVVLGWWLESIVTLVDGRERNATIRFMDGPFKVNVFAKRLDSWGAELVEGRVAGDQVLHRVEFAPDSFIDSLIQASDETVEACAENGWTTDAIDFVLKQREQLIQCRNKGLGWDRRPI